MSLRAPRKTPKGKRGDLGNSFFLPRARGRPLLLPNPRTSPLPRNPVLGRQSNGESPAIRETPPHPHHETEPHVAGMGAAPVEAPVAATQEGR